MHRKKELIVSTAITIFIFVLTLMDVPPFVTIMNWGESLSNSWSNVESEPPIPHAELMRLDELAKTLNLDINQVLQNLKSVGIFPDSQTIIVGDLAEKYNLTPQELFSKMKIGKNITSDFHQIGMGTGFGYGRMTVEQICQEAQISIDEGLLRLKKRNINAKTDSNIRELATANNLLPIDIVNIIQDVNL